MLLLDISRYVNIFTSVDSESTWSKYETEARKTIQIL